MKRKVEKFEIEIFLSINQRQKIRWFTYSQTGIKSFPVNKIHENHKIFEPPGHVEIVVPVLWPPLQTPEGDKGFDGEKEWIVFVTTHKSNCGTLSAKRAECSIFSQNMKYCTIRKC